MCSRQLEAREANSTSPPPPILALYGIEGLVAFCCGASGWGSPGAGFPALSFFVGLLLPVIFRVPFLVSDLACLVCTVQIKVVSLLFKFRQRRQVTFSLSVQRAPHRRLPAVPRERSK